MPQKQLNDTFDLGSDYFSGYLSKTEITDIDQKYISSVIDLDSLSKISRQLTVSMGSMMSLVDGFAILMFVILIYLLSKIIIDKNAQAISMTKILGYTNWEISRLYILSTSIVVVLFLLISLPIESIIMTGLFRAIMITSITGWIPLYMDPVIYVKNVRSWIWHLPDRSFTGVPENKKSAYGRGTQKYRIIIQTHIYPDTALPVLHLSLI